MSICDLSAGDLEVRGSWRLAASQSGWIGSFRFSERPHFNKQGESNQGKQLMATSGLYAHGLCICTHMPIYTHTYTWKHIWMYNTDTHMHAPTHSPTCTHMHTNMHMHTQRRTTARYRQRGAGKRRAYHRCRGVIVGFIPSAVQRAQGASKHFSTLGSVLNPSIIVMWSHIHTHPHY